jgi:hypothetical protein
VAGCPADVPAAVSIATDADATDLFLVADRVYFRAGTTLFEADTKGGARATAYASPSLVAAFVDADVIVALESQTPPNAELRVVPRTGATGNEPAYATGWDVGATTIFASDATSFYVLVNGANADTFYAVPKATPALATPVAIVEGVVSYPQLGGGAIWYVRDNQRVYKVDPSGSDPNLPPGLPGQATAAVEVFGSAMQCALAIGASHAFCSTGPSLEQRDLAGGSPKTILDVQASKARSLLGRPIAVGDTLFVRPQSAVANDPLKNVIRAVRSTATGADEKLVACGRERIVDVAADAKSVAWTEPGRGVFAAQR